MTKKMTNAEMMDQMMQMMQNINDRLDKIESDNNKPVEVANANAVDKPAAKYANAIQQDINLVWNTNDRTLNLVAVNASRVNSDLWSANYSVLKDVYKANYAKGKGIYWYKKDAEDFFKAKSEFEAITLLDVEAQIHLIDKKISDYMTKIEYLNNLIAEEQNKLNNLKSL